VRYAFIQEHRQEWPVKVMCEVLDVSRSGFYDWQHRVPSSRQQRRESLAAEIQQIFTEYRGVYGSPRVYRELQERGVKCCENTVAKHMQERQLQAMTQRRYVVQTTDSDHAYPVPANGLNQDFTAALPNEVWTADITYIPTAEGWLYLAVVLDLCSRKVVGWRMADHLRAELTCGALHMAAVRRRPGQGLLHHSDRGVQYACEDYQRLLTLLKAEGSMSRRGNCYDNAPTESFFGTLKQELIYRTTFATREQARQTIFEYIEVFYNRKRKHSSLGYMSPEAFEASLN
jgi:putative transposase